MRSLQREGSNTPLCRLQRMFLSLDNHDTYSFLKHHKWVEITDTSQPIVDKLVYCPHHLEELAKFNCKDCNELICLICNGTKHKLHQAESIQEALDRLIPTIKEQGETVKTRIKDNETLLADLKQRSKQIEKGYEQLEKEVDEKYDEVVRKARDDKQQTKQQLNEMKDKQMKDVEKSIRKVEITLKSQHNIIALSDTTLSTAQGTSLLQTIQSDVKGSLSSFVEERPTLDPCSFEFLAKFVPTTPSHNSIGEICCLETALKK